MYEKRNFFISSSKLKKSLMDDVASEDCCMILAILQDVLSAIQDYQFEKRRSVDVQAFIKVRDMRAENQINEIKSKLQEEMEKLFRL